MAEFAGALVVLPCSLVVADQTDHDSKRDDDRENGCHRRIERGQHPKQS
jgi:hypothetical protein